LLLVSELLADLVFLITAEALLSILPPSEVLTHGSIYPPINAQEMARQLVESGEASGFLTALLLAGFLAFIALIILIVVLIEVIRGFSALSNYVKLSNLGIYGVVVLFISAIVNVVAIRSVSSFIFSPAQLTAGAISIIGYIPIGIALYSIGKFYNQSLLKIGAILFIIPFQLIGDLIPLLVSPIPLSTAVYSSLPFSLITLISSILCYLGLNNVYKQRKQ